MKSLYFCYEIEVWGADNWSSGGVIYRPPIFLSKLISNVSKTEYLSIVSENRRNQQIMDNSTIISFASLLVALLSLPTSYLIAKRQVRFELAENERRHRQKTQLLVADYLDEFFKIFYATVREIVHIEPNELRHRLNEIDPYIAKIDFFVERTKVLERLESSINSLMETNFPQIVRDDDIVNRLLSIRNQINLGSDETRSVTLSVISICGGDTIQSTLRNIQR